jgi:hypothetical protein
VLEPDALEDQFGAFWQAWRCEAARQPATSVAEWESD